MGGAHKPLDFGGEGITGSLDALGRLIALNCYHPEYGYITLTSAAPFPEDARYDPTAVRAYRASLAHLNGFGIQVNAPIRRSSGADYGAYTALRLEHDAGYTEALTFITHGCAVQIWSADGERLTFDGQPRLMRCAYTQLTEGGPLPMPPTATTYTHSGDLLWIENAALGCVAVHGIPRQPAAHAKLIFAFGLTRAEAEAKLHHAVRADAPPTQANWERWWAGIGDDPILRRGLAYSHHMAIPVGEGICLLTDHMLLPLSWNRDAYYLARAMLSWHSDVHELVRRHLLWMFEIAQRVEGGWARCCLANGRVKDAAFQLDQQLFPLLELAEYVLETGDKATWTRLKPRVDDVIAMLLRRQADHVPLFPTDETPADDPIAQPYHLSSHILFWAALNKLNRLGYGAEALADDIRAAIPRYFTAEYGGAALLAYATDGRGGFHFYHDANDYPTILAPLWGFCAVDDPLWQGTMAFAFSEANTAGVYDGRLGSVHTRAPWSLGDVQELILARLLRDQPREAKALAALRFAAQIDGALPEAYDARSGAVVSRTWFAWSNAAYACAQMDSFRP